jgi:hypothetical protein
MFVPVAAPVVLVDPELEPTVAPAALGADLAVAVVAPYRPGSLPSGAETVPCVTETAFGSFE